MIELFIPVDKNIFEQRTYLNGNIVASSAPVNSITVDNTAGFHIGEYVVLGQPGAEKSEIVKISDVFSNTTLKVGRIRFPHTDNDIITRIKYTRRKLYRATSKTGVYAQILATSTINIEVDSPRGTFVEDPTGTAVHWYKATYYNPTSIVETTQASEVAIKGNESGHYTSIYKILEESGFLYNETLDWKIVNEYRLEAENIVDSYIKDKYVLPLATIPKIITRLTTLMAACYLLKKEYGEEAGGGLSEGKEKCEEAQKILAGIKDGSIKLVDEAGTELATASTDRLRLYPDASASDDEARMFSVTDKF